MTLNLTWRESHGPAPLAKVIIAAGLLRRHGPVCGRSQEMRLFLLDVHLCAN